jgi:hypothetical protein
LCWPAEQAKQRRHKTRIDGVRQLVHQGRRWLPGRRLVLVVDGGLAAVSLAGACVKQQVGMVSRLRWAAALDHPPGPQPPGTRGPTPWKGERHRSLQGWAARSATPWETVEVDCYRGQRQRLWSFSHTALWYTPGLPPAAIRDVLVCAPAGKPRLEAFVCTDVQATPGEILRWGGMRWAGEVTFAEARAHLGWGTPRPWSERAIARTTAVLLGLFSLVTILAWRLRGAGAIPVQQTAWYRNVEPPFADGLALVRQHLWRARDVVHSTPEAESMPWPLQAFDLLIRSLPLAA